MGGFQNQTNAQSRDGFWNLNAKKKLITIVIFVNLIIIGVYITRDKGRRSNAFFVSSSGSSLNENDDLTDDLDDPKRHRDRPAYGRVQAEFEISAEEDVENGLHQERLKEAGKGNRTSTDSVKDVGPAVLPKTKNGLMDKRTGKTTTASKEEYFLSSDVPLNKRQEKNSSLYSAAFPNHKIPASLLKWTPSPDSPKYFQPIDSQSGWVFSAYYQPPTDNQTDAELATEGSGGEAASASGSIRVMMIGLRQFKTLTFCQFYDHNGVKMTTKKGRRRSMKDRQVTKYGPFCMECPLPGRKVATKPYFVSLTSGPENNQPTNHVRIQYPGPLIRNFTVCFSPLHSNYNFTDQLVESFEFNRLLGADHFMVYNFSVSPQTETILRHYQSQGLVTVIQWPLPNLELWYYGQILAVNDCIYRNKGISKYVVVTDTDEIIVPHGHLNWSSLISAVDSTPSLREDTLSEKVLKSITRHTSRIHPHSPYGGWSFRCSFFADKRLEANELAEINKYQFSLEQKKFLVQFPSRSMLSLKKIEEAYDHGSKSKTIVRPECVDVGSVHVVAALKPGYQMAFVKPETALLHHYRDYRNSRQCNTLDASALRFKDEYLERLKNALDQFPNIFPAVARMHLNFVT